MPKYIVNIPEFNEVVWKTDADGVTDASFNGVDISISQDETDGEWRISLWVCGDLYDGDDNIDYDDIHDIDDAMSAAYDAAIDVLQDNLTDFGAEYDDGIVRD